MCFHIANPSSTSDSSGSGSVFPVLHILVESRVAADKPEGSVKMLTSCQTHLLIPTIHLPTYSQLSLNCVSDIRGLIFLIVLVAVKSPEVR